MTDFFAITLVILLAIISPGPDFALVVKNSLKYNRKAGLSTALGISLSLLIHSSYCILGLAIIITQSLLLFDIIKDLGAAYLIYLGIKSLFHHQKTSIITNEKQEHAHTTLSKTFTEGLLCNLLNPKAIMFILAFFTLIIKPETLWIEKIAYCLEIMTINFAWFFCLTSMINRKKVREALNKIEVYIIKIMGIVLIGFGTRIAFLHHLPTLQHFIKG